MVPNFEVALIAVLVRLMFHVILCSLEMLAEQFGHCRLAALSETISSNSMCDAGAVMPNGRGWYPNKASKGVRPDAL